MKGFQGLVGSIVKLAIIGACIYAVVNWKFGNSTGGGNRSYAESACIDEINASLSTQSANVYAVTQSDKGFVVRASVMLSNGTPAKFICLTNEFGRVEDVRIEER